MLYGIQGFKIRINPINITLTVFVMLTCLPILYAGSKTLATESATFTLYLFLFALLLQDYLLGNKVRIAIVGWILIISGLILACWVVSQDVIASINPLLLNVIPKLSDWRGFLYAGFGNTSHIGDFLALTLLLALLYFLYVSCI